MYPAGWPDEVHFGGSIYRYTGDHQQAMLALAASSQAENTQQWLNVFGLPLTDESRVQLVKDLYDRQHPLTCLGLTVLSEKVSQRALGMSMYASGRLAIRALQFWVPFAGWAAQVGLHLRDMPLHELLPAVYGWQISACKEDKEVDKLNLTIFGTKKPWGR